MKVQVVGETLFESKSTLRLIGVDGTIVEIKGAKRVIDLLKTILDEYKQYSLKEMLDNVELPMDMDILEKKKKEIADKIKTVTKRITELQKKINKLVMKLYGVDSAEGFRTVRNSYSGVSSANSTRNTSILFPLIT